MFADAAFMDGTIKIDDSPVSRKTHLANLESKLNNGSTTEEKENAAEEYLKYKQRLKDEFMRTQAGKDAIQQASRPVGKEFLQKMVQFSPFDPKDNNPSLNEYRV